MKEVKKDLEAQDFNENYQSSIELMLGSVDDADKFLAIQLIMDYPKVLDKIEYWMLKRYVKLLFNFCNNYRILVNKYNVYGRPYATFYYRLTSSFYDEGKEFHKLHPKHKVLRICKYIHEFERKSLPV